MSNSLRTNHDREEKLWEELSDKRAVMLGCEGSGHMQPMSPNIDEEKKLIWFYTKNTTDLVKACGRGKQASLNFSNDNDSFHCSIHGELREHKDPEIIDKYWSKFVSAWFDKGKDDPELTMMVFEPSEAALWSSTDSMIKFGWEIAKANLKKETPDIGYHDIIAINPQPVSTALHINN